MVLQLIGKVISNRTHKTVVVSVELRRWINKYQVWHTQLRKYMAHDGFDTCNIGDIVKIEPLFVKKSPRKAFHVIEIVEREKVVTDAASSSGGVGATTGGAARDAQHQAARSFEERPVWAGLPPAAANELQRIRSEYEQYFSVSAEALRLAERPVPTDTQLRKT